MSTTLSTLTFNALSCERDDRILFKNLSGKLEPGNILCVSGPNGIGKTTLLRILADLYQPDEGSVLINDEKVCLCRNQILYFGHKTQISKDLTIIDNLLFLTGAAPNILHTAFMAVGLEHYYDSRGRELSQGQQRRAALARLWCSSAPIWILDEPYTALDSEMVTILDKQISRHAEGGGICVFTTHSRSQLLAHDTLDLANVY